MGREAEGLRESCRTTTPTLSGTSSRSGLPIRPACWTWTRTQLSVGRPHSRYWPRLSVVTAPERDSYVVLIVARSTASSLQDVTTLAPPSGRSVSASSTRPTMAPVSRGSWTPGQAAARSVAPEGRAKSARAVAPPVIVTSRGGRVISSESRKGLANSTR
jgi:hypothetical protein